MSDFEARLNQEQEVLRAARSSAQEQMALTEAEELRTDGTDPTTILGNDAGLVLDFLKTLRKHEMPRAFDLRLKEYGGEMIKGYPIGSLGSPESTYGPHVFICDDERVRSQRTTYYRGHEGTFYDVRNYPSGAPFQPGLATFYWKTIIGGDDSPQLSRDRRIVVVDMKPMPLQDALPKLAAIMIEGF